MNKLFMIAAVCAAMLVPALPVRADFVCNLDGPNSFASVRSRPAGPTEVGRLGPRTLIVRSSSQNGWVKITVPGRPVDGWVMERQTCPGQPR
jgi:hypothetical protein